MRNILLLTPVYPANDVCKSTTPVVHYFTREWVRMGYNVIVIHYPVNFPRFVYLIAKPFKEIIGTKMGSEIRTWPLQETEYEIEGVKVRRFPLEKFKPHSRYSNAQIKKGVEQTISFCRERSFMPDVIVCHWTNPTLEIMHELKSYFEVPTCFVSHDIGFDLDNIFNNEAEVFLQEQNLIGYRSGYIKTCFESKYNCNNIPSFLCSSGIPCDYILKKPRIIKSINGFIFVGTLLKRKYPAEIVPAVYKVYGEDDFSITYIGDGVETKRAASFAHKFGISNKVHILGRMARNKVVEQLDLHEVFIMISKNETFGLVYLEAMARGCITIAARNEGFDGIIQDGVNGFLCKAGDVDELTSIISRIKSMPIEDLNIISLNAIETSRLLTDQQAAKRYIDMIEQYCI